MHLSDSILEYLNQFGPDSKYRSLNKVVLDNRGIHPSVEVRKVLGYLEFHGLIVLHPDKRYMLNLQHEEIKNAPNIMDIEAFITPKGIEYLKKNSAINKKTNSTKVLLILAVIAFAINTFLYLTVNLTLDDPEMERTFRTDLIFFISTHLFTIIGFILLLFRYIVVLKIRKKKRQLLMSYFEY